MNKMMKVIGYILVAICIIFLSNMLIPKIFENQTNELIRTVSIKNDLQRSTEEITKGLPMRVDENTVLIEMKYDQTTNIVTSLYIINGLSESEFNLAATGLKERLLDFIQNNPNNKEALSVKAIFEFVYKGEAGEQLKKILIYPEDYQ